MPGVFQIYPLPLRIFNDAKAAGFAELWNRSDLTDAFYILLSNHVGGAMIPEPPGGTGGEHPRRRNRPHDGHPLRQILLLRKSGLFRALLLLHGAVGPCRGDLDLFFRLLRSGDPVVKNAWEEYLYILSIAVNNINMLLDCPVILGGSVGAYLEESMARLRGLARAEILFRRRGLSYGPVNTRWSLSPPARRFPLSTSSSARFDRPGGLRPAASFWFSPGGGHGTPIPFYNQKRPKNQFLWPLSFVMFFLKLEGHLEVAVLSGRIVKRLFPVLQGK